MDPLLSRRRTRGPEGRLTSPLFRLTGTGVSAPEIIAIKADWCSPTILLNYLTAPNCLIWSAIIASAAVPGILNPVRPHHLLKL